MQDDVQLALVDALRVHKFANELQGAQQSCTAVSNTQGYAKHILTYNFADICCCVVQQRLWEHLDLTMRAAQHAEKVLRTTNVNDDDAVEGMTSLIDEVARKHDGIRNEMASHGVTVPIAPTTDMSQSLGGGHGGRRMAFERQIGDIKEACVQVLQPPAFWSTVVGATPFMRNM